MAYDEFMASGIQNDGVFLYFDGDDVGARIELHLLREEVEDAAAVSRAVVFSVGNIAEELRVVLGAQIVFAAGDEILAVVPEGPAAAEIEAVRSRFLTETGLTISCGVGASARDAANQLRFAKLEGKNRTAGVGPR